MLGKRLNMRLLGDLTWWVLKLLPDPVLSLSKFPSGIICQIVRDMSDRLWLSSVR